MFIIRGGELSTKMVAIYLFIILSLVAFDWEIRILKI